MVMISQQKESTFRAKDDVFYTNHKLAEFFGSEQISVHGKTQTKLKSSSMKRKIFSYLKEGALDNQSGTGVNSNGNSNGNEKCDEGMYEKFSLREIVMRHQAMTATRFKRTVGRFKVERPNKYAALETDENDVDEEDGDRMNQRIVDVKVFDVLFNHRVCNLVYIRDITALINDIKRS